MATWIGYLLGFAHLTFYANGAVRWVEEVTVEERQRRHGIGRQLVDDFAEGARWRLSIRVTGNQPRARVLPSHRLRVDRDVLPTFPIGPPQPAARLVATPGGCGT